jgi:DNA-directed RNA polymerase subunit RPC12/RpoP
LSDKEIVCTNCEAEFQVVHDEVDSPEYCPFCGDKIRYDDDEDEDIDLENWEEDV